MDSKKVVSKDLVLGRYDTDVRLDLHLYNEGWISLNLWAATRTNGTFCTQIEFWNIGSEDLRNLATKINELADIAEADEKINAVAKVQNAAG